MVGRMTAVLQYRFEALLIAVCTEAMGWFSVLHAFFRDISEKALPKVLKFIALLICAPCFKVSHFYFKCAFGLQQRRLRRLCDEDFFLKFYDCPIASGRFVDTLKSLGHIKCGLDGAQSSNR